MRPYRSMLYVPGNRPSWMEKASQYGADALILDLEDSVPQGEKVGSRPLVKEAVKEIKSKGGFCFVRVNGLATGLTFDDLEAVFCPELDGITLPKVESVNDMRALDTMITSLEKRHNIQVGSIETPLMLETAKAMKNAFEIAISCKRIRRIDLACGPGGDANRSIGYIWSKEGKETLFLRSKVVLDSRAAGLQYPMISSWWNVQDLEGLARDASNNRQLGFRGQVVIHPSHVPIINKIFTPSVDEIAYCKRLIETIKGSEEKGLSAIIYAGEMVDAAMVKSARDMLDFARTIGLDVK